MILHRLAKAFVGPFSGIRRFLRPIFLISPPRAGSTYLFECLAQFRQLRHVGREAHFVWQCLLPRRDAGASSHFVPLEEEIAFRLQSLPREFYRECIINDLLKRPFSVTAPYLLGFEEIRYLDKTISNCFRLDVLDEVFPDAAFVFLVRDPRSNIASMIEGWAHRGFRSNELTRSVKEIGRRHIEHWAYPAPPGWQRVVDKPLHEICAWSWCQHIEHMVRFLNSRSKQHFVAKYEDLVSDPVKMITELTEFLGLEITEQVVEYAVRSPLSATTLSRPSPEKWKDHRAEIRSVWHLVAKAAQSVGYNPVFSES